MMNRKRLIRLLVRFISFSTFLVLLWPSLQNSGTPRFAIQTSPFVAICSILASRSFGVGSIIGLAFAIIVMVRLRCFCRYICPMGLLLEGVAHGGLQKTTWWRKCPKVGRYAALITFVGAIVGYPILLWMDPLAIFSSSLSIRTAAGAVSGVLSGFGLAFLIFLGLTSGDFWCARICPLGGTQELLASLGARLKNKWKTRSAQSPAGFSPNMPALVARRVFVVGAIGIGIGLWARKIGAGRGTGAPLRPPGAIAEDRFAGLCIRCGNCLRACPAKIVHPDGGQAGVAGLLAPMIHYDKGYCLEDCSACTQACPSGALQPLSLKQKTGYVIGEALVDMSICLLALGNKDCNACLDSCPFDAVRIHWDEEHYVAYPVIDRDKCNGCGACEVACPTDEVKAIRVWRI